MVYILSWEFGVLPVGGNSFQQTKITINIFRLMLISSSLILIKLNPYTHQTMAKKYLKAQEEKNKEIVSIYANVLCSSQKSSVKISCVVVIEKTLLLVANHSKACNVFKKKFHYFLYYYILTPQND